MCNLSEEVKQKEILEYFERKYKVRNIVTQRTIRNWLKSLGIECIQPAPKRNADRRYRKEDILKLEQKKMSILLNKQYNRQLEEYESQRSSNLRENAQDEFKKRILVEEDYGRFLNALSHERMGEDFDSQIDAQAKKIIEQDMLELCFNKLFPNTIIDTKELKQKLATVDSNIMADDIEKGIALDYIKRKLYIKH